MIPTENTHRLPAAAPEAAHPENGAGAAALAAASAEIAFLRKEHDKRAAELELARLELSFQSKQMQKRANELRLANRELVLQNRTKEARAAELIIANEELAYENEEKERRAAELVVANEELVLQNHEKEKRAAELRIANIDLAWENSEKEARAAELHLANEELAFQNQEKEKRAAELVQAVAELEAFAYVSSHDLQEPLRKILLWIDQVDPRAGEAGIEKNERLMGRIARAAGHMRQLILDLYTYSRLNVGALHFEPTGIESLLGDVQSELAGAIAASGAVIETGPMCTADIVRPQFRQLLHRLLSNALLFTTPERTPLIRVSSVIEGGEAAGADGPGGRCILTVSDNGIGFDSSQADRIFKVFQRLHSADAYAGTGIGLAIVKKVAEAHGGTVQAAGTPGEGAVFTVSFPATRGGLSAGGQQLSLNAEARLP
ncbi:sensor histidine kinase [Flaviaesturariibacter amylovorans]|uniref:histidine kinase n=1 Tax=Flaviaesturariibacter amylovorans TaxID=1084520 RepID=A0ABP8HNR7_9BACT